MHGKTAIKIKFLVKLGNSGNEIREMLVQVYGDNSMKKTRCGRGSRIFQKSRRHLNILGARRAPRRKFDAEGPQISDTTAHYLGPMKLISTFGVCKRCSSSL
jgi:hypothetical protein